MSGHRSVYTPSELFLQPPLEIQNTVRALISLQRTFFVGEEVSPQAVHLPKRLLKTISRDTSEVDVPDLSFSSADLGIAASFDTELRGSREVRVGTRGTSKRFSEQLSMDTERKHTDGWWEHTVKSSSVHISAGSKIKAMVISRKRGVQYGSRTASQRDTGGEADIIWPLSPHRRIRSAPHISVNTSARQISPSVQLGNSRGILAPDLYGDTTTSRYFSDLLHTINKLKDENWYYTHESAWLREELHYKINREKFDYRRTNSEKRFEPQDLPIRHLSSLPEPSDVYKRRETFDYSPTNSEKRFEPQDLPIQHLSSLPEPSDVYERLFSQGLVTSEALQDLFKANDLIIKKSRNQMKVYAVGNAPNGRKGTIYINCWSWKYDGFSFERKYTSLEVVCPRGDSIQITELEVYPLVYAPAETLKDLTARALFSWELRNYRLISYNGWNVTHTEEHENTRFMIDTYTHRKLHPTSSLVFSDIQSGSAGIISHDDPWPHRVHRSERLEDKSMLLLPDTAAGFNLNTKKWEDLSIENMSYVTWHKSAFDRLVLPSKTKELVKALVMNRRENTKGSDIFYGKGKGLIMLLHGGPGTGKTLTAESVAEIAERPLYRVTCGDIGTEVDTVEEYLELILALGKAWNCVLLLDEADVFLEERSLADLKRNSLVSVFLRILEYYEGIMILTSNRVGIFDEAFKSRIQVALHYENLTKSSRKKIWQNFIEMLEEQEVDANCSELESHLEDLASVEMNGRQIRNGMTTARQLAEYRKQTLDWDHLEQAIKTAADFNRYLEKVHGHQDDRWARDGGLR